MGTVPTEVWLPFASLQVFFLGKRHRQLEAIAKDQQLLREKMEAIEQKLDKLTKH
jgi:hypothetical protein